VIRTEFSKAHDIVEDTMREYVTANSQAEEGGEGEIEGGQQRGRKKLDILSKILVAAQEKEGEAYMNVNAHK
jgi:hypothetical protein